MGNGSAWTLKYFPERFRRRHSGVCRLATQLLNNTAIHMPTQDTIERLQRGVTEQYNQIIFGIPRDLRPARPTPVIAPIMSLAIHLARFRLAGRQIYDVSPKMLKVLASANYREVPVGMLTLPFSSIYLHFGSQPFTIKGAPFEGAIVSRYRNLFEFTFLTTPTAGWMEGNMVSHPVSYLYLSFELDNEDVDAPLGEVVDRAIAEHRRELEEVAKRPSTVSEIEGTVVVDRLGEAAQEDLENFEIAVTSLDEAMNLVINTLIYITSYREYVDTRWSDGTPEEVAKTADGAGRPKQVNEAKIRALEDGYYKAHFVGEKSEHADVEDSGGSGGTVSPHWRRAHWRVQRHGPGLQDRKAVLIPQVLVNASKLTEGQEPLGRVSRI